MGEKKYVYEIKVYCASMKVEKTIHVISFDFERAYKIARELVRRASQSDGKTYELLSVNRGHKITE